MYEALDIMQVKLWSETSFGTFQRLFGLWKINVEDYGIITSMISIIKKIRGCFSATLHRYICVNWTLACYFLCPRALGRSADSSDQTTEVLTVFVPVAASAPRELCYLHCEIEKGCLPPCCLLLLLAIV